MELDRFNLQSDLVHLDAVLDRIGANVAAAAEVVQCAERIQSQLSAMGYERTEEEREWVAQSQAKAKAIADAAHSVPIRLWSFASASIDVQGDLVKSIEALGA